MTNAERNAAKFSCWCNAYQSRGFGFMKRDWFTMVDALAALKGEICKATLYRKKDAALQLGLLEQKVDKETGGFLYRWKRDAAL